jgi:hypothetical protein
LLSRYLLAMVRSRVVHWQMQVLTVGMAALSTVAAASSTSSSSVVMASSTGDDPSHSMALPVLLDDEPDSEAEAEVEAEVSYKSKADWWKDPLAAFDDDTDNDEDDVEVEQPVAIEVKQPVAVEVQQEEEGEENVIKEDSNTSTDIIEDEPNDTYKSNADWWRDPLAAFDDDTDDDYEEEVVQEEARVENPVDQSIIFTEEAVKGVVPAMEDDVLVILTDEKKDGETNVETAMEGDNRVTLMDEKKDGETKVVTAMEDDNLVNFSDDNETIDGATGTEEPMILPESSKQVMNDQAIVLKAADRQIVSLRRTMAGSLAAPLALFLPSLPKVQALFTRLPVVTLLAIVTVMRVLYEPLLHLSGNRQPKTSQEEELRSSNDDDNFSSERDRHREKRLQDEEEEQQQNVEPDKRKFWRSRKAPSTQDDEAEGDDVKNQSPGWFEQFFPKPLSHEKLPPARELMEKVQQLQGAAEIAVSDRDSMEREYEKASWQVRILFLLWVTSIAKRPFHDQLLLLVPFFLRQLQEAQTELSSLTSTTRYLKAQLIDNEHIMERAIKAERARAKKELTRMKEAMLKVLERERKAMRDELVKQTAEVQALLQNEPQSEL